MVKKIRFLLLIPPNTPKKRFYLTLLKKKKSSISRGHDVIYFCFLVEFWRNLLYPSSFTAADVCSLVCFLADEFGGIRSPLSNSPATFCFFPFSSTRFHHQHQQNFFTVTVRDDARITVFSWLICRFCSEGSSYIHLALGGKIREYTVSSKLHLETAGCQCVCLRVWSYAL